MSRQEGKKNVLVLVLNFTVVAVLVVVSVIVIVIVIVVVVVLVVVHPPKSSPLQGNKALVRDLLTTLNHHCPSRRPYSSPVKTSPPKKKGSSSNH